MIGREKPRNVSRRDAESVTGGDAQRNPEDYIELAAASAAYDFYQNAKAHMDKPVFGDEAEIFYRTMSSDDNNSLSFESFFGTDKDKFAQNAVL